MSKTTESKTFKQLKAVMKDVNGDNRQIIKTMQDQIDYLMEFIEFQKTTSFGRGQRPLGFA